MTFLLNYNLILQISQGILGATTINIDKYAFLCGSNCNESDVIIHHFTKSNIFFLIGMGI